jgi:peptide deformylase
LLKAFSADDLAERERRPVPFHVIINPVIAYSSDEMKNFYEGCLSLPGFSAVVPRTRTIRVKYLDERGEAQFIQASGWYARILQHEIDHLHGALYIDRMLTRTFTTLDNWTRLHKGKPVPQSQSDVPK